jgi:hypothetical protein
VPVPPKFFPRSNAEGVSRLRSANHGITYPPEKISEVRRFVRKYRVNYPVASGGAGSTKLLFDQRSLKTTVIDRKDCFSMGCFGKGKKYGTRA